MKRFLEILGLIGPQVMAAIGGPVGAAAGLVQHAVGIAEQAGEAQGLSGADKKALALQLVTDGMGAANAIVGRTVVDPTALASEVGAGIDTVVTAVNLVQQAHPAPVLVATTGPALPTTAPTSAPPASS